MELSVLLLCSQAAPTTNSSHLVHLDSPTFLLRVSIQLTLLLCLRNPPPCLLFRLYFSVTFLPTLCVVQYTYLAHLLVAVMTMSLFCVSPWNTNDATSYYTVFVHSRASPFCRRPICSPQTPCPTHYTSADIGCRTPPATDHISWVVHSKFCYTTAGLAKPFCEHVPQIVYKYWRNIFGSLGSFNYQNKVLGGDLSNYCCLITMFNAYYNRI